MAWLPVSGLPPQYASSSSELATDHYLKFYELGTTTPVSMAIDSTGPDGTLLSEAKLNDLGIPVTNPLDDSTVFVPYMEVNYKAVVFNSLTAANANDLSNALFIADNIEVGQIITGNAADLTIRDTTILTQDDYDRSILFTDGDGFTAGAGPHVFTVPTDYTPTDSDFRAYKRDNSGIMAPIVIQSETSTQFTYTGTLASTDTIFIGDDTNRALRTNYSELLEVELSNGTGTPGEVDIIKVGKNVTIGITVKPTFTAAALFTSGVVLPESYRPKVQSEGVYFYRGPSFHSARYTVKTDGSLQFNFFDPSTGTGSSQTTLSILGSISFVSD